MRRKRHWLGVPRCYNWATGMSDGHEPQRTQTRVSQDRPRRIIRTYAEHNLELAGGPGPGLSAPQDGGSPRSACPGVVHVVQLWCRLSPVVNVPVPGGGRHQIGRRARPARRLAGRWSAVAASSAVASAACQGVLCGCPVGLRQCRALSPQGRSCPGIGCRNVTARWALSVVRSRRPDCPPEPPEAPSSAPRPRGQRPARSPRSCRQAAPEARCG